MKGGSRMWKSEGMVSSHPWPVFAELAIIVDHLYGHAEVGHHHGVQPGEMTLTDVAMLSQKRRRFPFLRWRGSLPQASNIKVHKFTNPQEGVTGADWNLLIFDSSSKRVSFRIQAKNLYVSGKFSKFKVKQADRLIKMSRGQGAIPLFGLYQGPQYSPVASKREARSACLLKGANDRMGCVVRDADSLKAAKPTTRRQWQRETSLALPLNCLGGCFCYPGGGGQPFPNGGGLNPYPNGSPANDKPVFDPSKHDQLPLTLEAGDAGRIVTNAAMGAAEASGKDKSVVNRLIDAYSKSKDAPKDRLGPYWDEHAKQEGLPEAGGDLFEGISHLVVIDERESG